MEKWLITYSLIEYRMFTKESEYRETVIHDGSIDDFMNIKVKKDGRGRIEIGVVIYFAVRL